ncbi:Divergent major capsid protein [uncultured virus]|nr:Divergent major capsid protein [uncultured virus]
MHMPEDLKKGADHKGNEVSTVFFREYRRSTWYYQFSEVLEVSNAESKFTFRVKPQPHGLLYTDLNQRLPQVVCRDGYEARWCHNPASNVVVSGMFVHNDTPIQTIDQVGNDMYGQSMIKDDRDTRDLNMGNSVLLQSWNSALPNFETSFMLPWFYAKNSASYFPLYFCGILDRIEHRMELRRDVGQLLHVREKKTGEAVAPDSKSLKSFDGKAVTQSPRMPVPTMWGQYLYLSDLECTGNRCAVGSDREIGDFRNIFYIDDYIIVDEENPKALGDSVCLKISQTDYPVHGIGWVAQNYEALRDGYYSNYTTNPDDHQEGWSPIEESSLDLGSKVRILTKMPSYRTERVLPGKQYACVPRVPGFNFVSLAVYSPEDTHKPGVVIKNGELTVKLRDTNPLVGIRDGQKASSSTFLVKARLSYTKRVVFKEFLTQESQRTTKNSVIEIGGQA